MRKAIARLLVPGAYAAAVLLVVGLALRLTTRDEIDGCALLFYVTPWPVIAVGVGVLAVFWAWKKRRVAAWMFAVLAVGAGAAWLGANWFWHPLPTRRGELRVIHWNVSRPTSGLPAVARWLRAQDADVITLAEGHRRGFSNLARWQAEMPGYEVAEFPGEMTCLVRGRILAQESRMIARNSYGALLQIETRGRVLTLVQADLTARPRQSRRNAFRNLTDRIAPHFGENLIVLGDFNTPRESVHLAPLRAEMANAFEAAGRGLADTWPMPLPVLSLDQIWGSRRLRPVSCTHGHSLRSDHRAVIADFDFTDPAPGAPVP
ncbi:MAG: endonuclease/exonuclease/phosphatase family protein [Chthoniobacter sp.]|nr:endonuclease/exonuclease/phosphatase family protein [Chthoniobacter sp.]